MPSSITFAAQRAFVCSEAFGAIGSRLLRGKLLRLLRALLVQPNIVENSSIEVKISNNPVFAGKRRGFKTCLPVVAGQSKVEGILTLGAKSDSK